MTVTAQSTLHALACFDGTGSIRAVDQVSSVTRTGDGAYEVVLEEALGTGEALVVATAWFAPGGPYSARIVVASLDADEVTLQVRAFDAAGVAIDTEINLIVYRILA
jgi:hypothetical protein